MIFYPGLHQPADAKHFERACISIHRLLRRKKALLCGSVFVDSGAFTVLNKHGRYPEPVEVYAAQLHELYTSGAVAIEAAVAQDYMCEPFVLAKTGLSIAEHQRLTVERYDALTAELRRLFKGEIPFQVLPVLQGWTPDDYLTHLAMYGDRIAQNMWVGVGSVCKRQGDVGVIEGILKAIKTVRPDLRLHGFGVKLTALKSALVRKLLFSADSMAWSFAARKQGRNANDWREAARFTLRVEKPLDSQSQANLIWYNALNPFRTNTEDSMNIEINFNIRFSAAIEAAALALLSGVSVPKDTVAPGAAHAPAPKTAPVVEPVDQEGDDRPAVEAPKNRGGRPKKADTAPQEPAGGQDAPAAEQTASSSAQTDAGASSAPEGGVTKAMCQDAMGAFLAKEGNSGLAARQIIIDNADGATSLSNADPKFYPVIFEKLGGTLPAAA